MVNVDYPSAIPMFVDESRVFINQNTHFAIVIHKTANGGPGNAQSVAQYFQTNTDMHSTHYIVGQDGTVVQCVLEKDGAAGNCCVEQGFDLLWLPFVQKGTNLNLVTLSIEHVDPTTDNSTPLTASQKQASFKLVKYLCDTYSIPPGRVKGHNTIDPINRAKCPGNYPWQELMRYLGTNTLSTTAAQQKEFDDCWSSFQDSLFNFYGFPQTRPIPKGTGIYHAWKAAWLAGHVYGPPLTFEYQSNDWEGNPITVQEFAHARCEWSNGQARWYS
jgi:N-acetyl-anhydromuramyl-L-alanine amidase AmpD